MPPEGYKRACQIFGAKNKDLLRPFFRAAKGLGRLNDDVLTGEPDYP